MSFVMIGHIHRIIETICKGIISVYRFPHLCNQIIRTDKPSDLRVIISCIQVVELCLCIIILASVAERFLVKKCPVSSLCLIYFYYTITFTAKDVNSAS